MYVESSFEEGAPDYASLNNLEMIMGGLGEYVTNASVFEESCNVIVTNTTMTATADPSFFGPASFHEDDYPFFYNNIKDNVAKRIATYKNSTK